MRHDMAIGQKVAFMPIQFVYGDWPGTLYVYDVYVPEQE
jgi:hypothetical protein